VPSSILVAVPGSFDLIRASLEGSVATVFPKSRGSGYDAAVAKAYGWADYTPEMPDEEILRRLLALNLERAARA
jgi:hypothetical protein